MTIITNNNENNINILIITALSSYALSSLFISCQYLQHYSDINLNDQFNEIAEITSLVVPNHTRNIFYYSCMTEVGKT